MAGASGLRSGPGAAAGRPGRRRPRRPGSSFLEVQVAFAVLGVALAGLAPTVVSQIRLVSRIEAHLPPGSTRFFAMADDPWLRKLGAPAALSASPTTPPAPGPPPSHRVAIESVTSDPAADLAAAAVRVEQVEPDPEGEGEGGDGGGGPPEEPGP